MVLGREPVVWLELVRAVLIVLATFVAPLSDAQQGAVLLAASAALAWLTRSRVSPVKGE